MWCTNGLAKIVKVDAKLFVVTLNAANALIYIKDMGSVTFLDHDNEGHHTIYAMIQSRDNNKAQLSRPILTFIEDFNQSLDSD